MWGGNSLTRNTVQASPGTVCISWVFFSSCAQIWKGIERQPFGLSLEPKFYDLGKFKQWRHFHKTMQFRFKRWLPFSQHKAPEQWVSHFVKSTMRSFRFPNQLMAIGEPDYKEGWCSFSFLKITSLSFSSKCQWCRVKWADYLLVLYNSTQLVLKAQGWDMCI